MTTMQARELLEVGLKTINTVITNLENTLLKAGEGRDEKTISLISRMIAFLRKTALILSQLSSRLNSSENNIVVLAPYTYIFRAENGIVLLRSRPEHVVVSVNSSKPSVTIKIRYGSLTITPSAMEVRVRGLSIEVDPRNIDSIKEKRDELRASMRIFEKVLYRRIAPFVEHIVKKH